MADKPSSSKRRSEDSTGNGTHKAAPGSGKDKPASAGASAHEAEAKAALAAERAAKRAEAKEARKVGLDDDAEGKGGRSATDEKVDKGQGRPGRGGRGRKLSPRVRHEREERTRKQAARSGNPRRAAQAHEEPSRYTAPIPASVRSSPWWVPALMFACFGLGILIIFFNYIEFPFGAAATWRTLLGLGFILVGIMTATQYH